MRYGPAILVSIVILASAGSVIGYLEYQRQREIKIAILKESEDEIKTRWIAARRAVINYAEISGGKASGSADDINAAVSRAGDVNRELVRCQWEIRHLEGFDDPEPAEDQTDYDNSLVQDYNSQLKLNQEADRLDHVLVAPAPIVTVPQPVTEPTVVPVRPE